MRAEGNYKIYEIDLSKTNWEKEMKEAFDEVFLARTQFYQLLNSHKDKKENK